MILRCVFYILTIAILASCAHHPYTPPKLKTPIVETGTYKFQHVPTISLKNKRPLKGWVIGVVNPIWYEKSYNLAMHNTAGLRSNFAIVEKRIESNPFSDYGKSLLPKISQAMLRDVSTALQNAGAEVLQFNSGADLTNIPYGDKKRMHALILINPSLMFGLARESYELINDGYAAEAKGFPYSSYGNNLNIIEPLSKETIFTKSTPFATSKGDEYRKTWLVSDTKNINDVTSYQSYSNRSKRIAEILTKTYDGMLDQIGKNLTVEDFLSHKSDVMELKGLKRF